MSWLESLYTLVLNNEPCVVVLVAEVEGSAPRPAGTRMVVTATTIHDSIGGGALELEAISHARALLSSDATVPVISSRQLSLGKSLSQCCGGRVILQFEYHPANDFIVHVFGAGHVAQELARILPRLPCRVTFHDSRAEWLEKVVSIVRNTEQAEHAISSDSDDSVSPGRVNASILQDNPYAVVDQCESAAYFVIMTHSHELDLELVEAVLTRGDAAYCGLIASRNKAISFRKRLLRKGFTESEVEQLTAPLGESVDTGNSPMEVAVSAVADLLTRRQQQLVDKPAVSCH